LQDREKEKTDAHEMLEYTKIARYRKRKNREKEKTDAHEMLEYTNLQDTHEILEYTKIARYRKKLNGMEQCSLTSTSNLWTLKVTRACVRYPGNQLGVIPFRHYLPDWLSSAVC